VRKKLEELSKARGEPLEELLVVTLD